jgi:F0F1-type ATP synthase assembly protein I
MSITQSPTPTPPPARTPDPLEVTVVSHSTLFYWWPVWFVGFLLGILSLFSPDLMAIVPKGSEAYQNAKVIIATEEKKTEIDGRDVIVVPKDRHLPSRMTPGDLKSPPANPRLHIATGKGFGVLFTTVLLLVVVITNVPLRGMASVMVIVLIILLSIIFALAGWWEGILRNLGYLDIRVNAGGYFFISGILFVIWLLTFIFFDRQIYMVFLPSQFKVCQEIGGGEQVYPTIGMTLERRRSDLFRHWILGFGSGDLVVKTTGAQAHHFEMPNVLSINRKVQEIEDLMKKQTVIETR